jgi:hypothetical protein
LGFNASDGSTDVQSAAIVATAEGTPGIGTVPARIDFRTAPQGQAFATERMRITNTGSVCIGNSTVAANVALSTSAMFAVGGGTAVSGVPSGNSYFNIGSYGSGGGGNNSNCFASLNNYNNDGYGEYYYAAYYRGTPTSVLKCEINDTIGGFRGSASYTNGGTGATYPAASIDMQVDAATTSGQHCAGRMIFSTTPNNGSLTERMRIDSTGHSIFTPSSTTPPTLATNGNFNLTPTSNTNMRISYRGSDGTTRVANITLA